MAALIEMVKDPRTVLGPSGWPERIYSGIDWSLAQSSAKHDGEHLHWVCTMCREAHHGSRAWAVSHAIVHGLVWDSESQCMLRVANVA